MQLIEIRAEVGDGEGFKTEGKPVPCLEHGFWLPVIDAETGTIINWTEGTAASIHVKVCDACEIAYHDTTTGAHWHTRGSDYVPDFLSPAENGYGDYIIMNVMANGHIAGWLGKDVEMWLREGTDIEPGGHTILEEGILSFHGYCYHPFLVVFEGVDNSGKTTVSKALAKILPSFRWTKEPVFTTEQADRLNSEEYRGKDAKREVLFLEGRLQQQKVYNSVPCLLDRYLWSGMAYAKAFSPSIYEFCKELYTDYNIFKKPDITFFMDTPLETCYDREPKLKEEPGRLERIREAYRDTENLVGEVHHLDGRKTVDELVDECLDVINNKLRECN